jgi:uroporphyrinogen III methyltransferase / synthase
VLLPRALVAREVLPDELGRHGVIVDVVPAYETRRATPEAQARLRELVERNDVDVVLLSSSSMVEAFVEALGGDASSLPSSLVVGSIGDITTQSAMRLGLRIDVTAEDSTLPGLVTALERVLDEREARR